MNWCIKTYIIAYLKKHTQKKYIFYYVKPTAQPLF